MKPATKAFELPETDEIQSLLVERMNETTLRDDSPVLCLNRGRRPLHVMWDGNHIDIPPGGVDAETGKPFGYFRTEYAAAQHMKKHLIVPGTRNIEEGGFISWIAILGSEDGRVAVDPADECQLFTDEELQKYGEAIEAIDRQAMSDPSARDVVAVRTGVAAARTRGQAVGGLRPVIGVDAQATDAAREAAENVFDPPTESLTRAAEAEAAAERSAPARTARARAR